MGSIVQHMTNKNLTPSPHLIAEEVLSSRFLGMDSRVIGRFNGWMIIIVQSSDVTNGQYGQLMQATLMTQRPSWLGSIQRSSWSDFVIFPKPDKCQFTGKSSRFARS